MKLNPTTRRILTALAAIALLAAGGLMALYLAARPLQPLAASHPPPPEVVEPHSEPGAPALTSLMLTDDVLTPAGATPLEGLPLNLPIYHRPGVTATKLAAWQRESADGGEQIAVYSFRGADLQAIGAFYNDQAHRLGFTLQSDSDPKPPGGAGGGSKVYSRDDQVLLVRMRPLEEPFRGRLTILLRYTERR